MKVCPHCGKQFPDTMTLCSADASVLRSVDDPLLNLTLAKKYRIEQLIKRGGMGAVYRGKHVLMDKTVAIKVLRPSLAADPEVVARFSREAKAASRISHPHAVSVTDFGEADNGVVFLVMEYLDGRSLKEIIKSEGPMSLARAREIIRQVAGALDAAHGEGVIHRDLKSENIMLVRHDGGDWAKVLDFGIAKIKQAEGARDVDLTAPDLVIGTPQYMSPEQCSESKTIDARSDVYSLGVILFEMLAGRVPFTGESATQIMMKQVQEPPPPLLATRRDLPLGTGDVVARALAKDPEDRFQTAGELSEALSRAAEGEEVARVGSAIGAQTTPSESIRSDVDDVDEITVVRQPPPLASYAPESAHAAVNLRPWRIIVPSVVALLVVFVTVFLFTRNSGQTPTQQTPGQTSLSADPNAQPVQPAGPPSGESEKAILPNTVSSPISVPSPNANANTNTNANKEFQFPPSNVNENLGANVNENQNTSERGKKNVNPGRESPSPVVVTSPTTNAQPTLKPSPSAAPPAPKPRVVPTAQPKPTQTP